MAAPSTRLSKRNSQRFRLDRPGHANSGARSGLSRAGIHEFELSSRTCVDGSIKPLSTAARRSALQVSLAAALFGVTYQIGQNDELCCCRRGGMDISSLFARTKWPSLTIPF